MFVFSHPYFDVTTTAGTFDLKNLPPGTYTIEAWQEKYGTQDQTVTIGPNESKAISFRFSTGRQADLTIQTPSVGFAAAAQLTKSLCKAYTPFTGPTVV